MQMTATYDPTDNKLRLSAPAKLPPDLYTRVKAAGFAWAPKQGVFVAPAWSPAREDLLLELCGTIDDEDTTLVERSEQRAERFEDYRDKRAQESSQAHQAVERLMDGIPLGQPILRGHHSERHARKDAERIQSGARKAVNLWQQSTYWSQRAQGALRHATYKERPEVRARRIKGLEADERKQARHLAQVDQQLAFWRRDDLTRARAEGFCNMHDHTSFCFPLADYPREPPASQYEGERSLWSALTEGIITWEQARALVLPVHTAYRETCLRWLEHFKNRLAYERAMLGAVGGILTDQTTPEKGGACQCWASPGYGNGWSFIVKVNKVSVTVEDNWSNDGRNFTRTMPFDKLKGLMSAHEVETARTAGRLQLAKNGTGFFLLGEAPPPPPAPVPVPSPAEQACRDDWTAQGVPVERQDAMIAEITAKASPAALEALRQVARDGVQTVTVPQLFPTPPALAARMVALAHLEPGQRVLEPSAGSGQLLGAITHSDTPVETVAIELHGGAMGILQAQQAAGAYPRTRLWQDDFLCCTVEKFGRFDAVLMNPPFAKGQDMAHVTHALAFLKPGGTLIAVMSSMAGKHQAKADTAFMALLARQEAYRFTPLEPGTFHDSGTDVNTTLLQVTAPAAPPPKVRPLVQDAAALSSGTLATLTGERTYATLDLIRNDFVCFCEGHDAPSQPWQEAWHLFWDARQTPTPEPRIPAPSLPALAATLDTLGQQTQAQITRARVEAEARTRLHARKPQAPPVGLFAQEQRSLW